ncbi:hypothetical protein HIM_01860 [Hirsutella minnesotensis 3608]|nr:hypothetical protein HIM_01860 [Hirsutella minnesotensis 3608]
MDGYPEGCLDHNVPLLVASGLSAKEPRPHLQGELRNYGFLLKSDSPVVEGKVADFVNRYFAQIDAHGASWTSVSRDEPFRFRIRTIGRSFALPPRKARLPESAELPAASTPVLHSPFSPLSTASALYPDGLIDAPWIQKHQEMIPAIYACFYTLGNDTKLKADVNGIKGTLAKSGYKTRVAVFLLGEGGSTTTGGVQERLEGIRKGTALDPKSIFFIPAQNSPGELKRLLDNALSVLYTTAIEYYRDLGRHARKKRSRGIVPQPTVPPTTGTSRTPSLPDWNFRYDFKAAVLAEFRQEIDAANRSFEQAYEILLGQDVLDIIPSWSPRWNEARMLSDVITIRCLRIQLWLGHTTLAVRRWQSHRDRIGDFVDRRGRGTGNYGWQAWEARWATVMAHLVEKVGLASLAPSTMTLFLQPEKAVLGERLKPWEQLHHTGYWYRMAARHTAERRALARLIPEEDRGSPDSSSASQAVSKAYTYDTYMCPAPYREIPLQGQGVNHAQLIIDCLLAARTQFLARDQLRLAAEVSLESAAEMASIGAWEDALGLVRPIWDDLTFRSEGWADASEELGWLLRQAAKEMGRADLVVAADWELMHRKFSRRRDWLYDVAKSLDGTSPASKPSVILSDESAAPFLSASFIFCNKDGKAGEKCAAQLVVFSEALPDSTPATLSSIQVDFEGSLGPIVIEHAASEHASSLDIVVDAVPLEEAHQESSDDEFPSRVAGQADLTLHPGQKRVFEMLVPLRQAGDAEASSVTLSYRSDAYDLDYRQNFGETDAVVGWYVVGSRTPRRARPDARHLHIQPRPPKMQINVANRLAQYYTNEAIEWQLDIRNDEAEPATVRFSVDVFGEHRPSCALLVGDQQHDAEHVQDGSSIAPVVLGVIGNGASRSLTLRVDPMDKSCTPELHLRASYHLESDAATRIVQVVPVQLSIVTPFEANYDLVPRLHTDPWPSLFDDEGLEDLARADLATAPARGVKQQWCLICHYASFALEDLCIIEMDVHVPSSASNARCIVLERPELSSDGMVVAPRTMGEAQFSIVAHKVSLDDRQPVAVDMSFIIKWRRQGAPADSAVNTTILPVGQYLVLGTEPRVLASVFYEARETWPSLMYLDITIENPSNHFLTFGLTMEPSDAFAFSGAKQTTAHLLPLSRRTMRYRLLPLVQGTYLRPGLVVRDKYFQKTLRIIPTEWMKIDKDGLLVWVPGEGAAEGEGQGETSAAEGDSDGESKVA